MEDEQTRFLAAYLRSYAGRAPSSEHARIAKTASDDLERLLAGQLTRRQRYFSLAKRLCAAATLAVGLVGSAYVISHHKTAEDPGSARTTFSQYLDEAQDIVTLRRLPSPCAPACHDPPISPMPGPRDTARETPHPRGNDAGKMPSVKTPILMYHKFDEAEDRFTTSPRRFRQHLDYLRENGYTTQTFAEYASQTPVPGTRPVVLTFDDSTAGQFRMLPDGTIDPDSAVGIMQEYRRQHPAFRLTGTFFVNMESPEGEPMFGQQDAAAKAKFLVANGYELGYHGYKHHDFAKLDALTLQDDMGRFKRKMEEYVPQYRVLSFAYPYGSLPARSMQQILEGTFPYTAHAWGGIAKGQSRNAPRIETGPVTRLASYLPGWKQEGQPFTALADDGNVYKGVPNLRQHARHHPQLPSQHPQTVRQPDDRCRGWRGFQGEGDSPRGQERGVPYWQEGHQGRDPLSPRQQGSAPCPLRDWYAWPSDWRDSHDPVSLFCYIPTTCGSSTSWLMIDGRRGR